MYNGQQSQFGAPGLQKSNSIEIESPLRKYMRWPVLTLAAAVVAFLGSLVLPTLHTHGAWPMVDFAVWYCYYWVMSVLVNLNNDCYIESTWLR